MPHVTFILLLPNAPMPLNVSVFFPRILSNYVFNGLVYGSFNPYIPIASNYSCSVSILLSANQQNIVAVRGFFTPDYPICFYLLPRIIPLSGPIPFIIVLHIFSHSANWLLHPVITAVLDLFPNVRFFLAQLLLPWFLSLPHVILRYVLVYLFYVLSQRRSVCSCYHSNRELNGNVCHPTKLTQVRWDDSGIVTGIGHLSSHMVQQIQSQFIL